MAVYPAGGVGAVPGLSRYRPLSTILAYDEFDHGLQGWTELIGNYQRDPRTVLPGFRDLRPPMLSNATMWDTGSAGSVSGTYSMKLATRARSNSMAAAIKRLTFSKAHRVQLEAFITFKPEASKAGLQETDLRGFGFFFDIQSSSRRMMPHVRYLNAEGGELRQTWQTRRTAEPRVKVGREGMGSTFHLSPEGWTDLPDGHQPLCYNELATKQNWHYVRLTVDLDAGVPTELACNDAAYDLRALSTLWLEPEPTLAQMLNVAFFVETDESTRAYLFVDSVLLSTDQE